MTTDLGKLGKRLNKGESDAFVELYDLIGQRIFRYLYAQLGSSDDASDIVQETFVQLVKSHRRLGKATNLNGYVFAVARNEMIRWMKRKKKTSSAEELGAEPVVEHQFEHQVDSQDWIQETLKRLEPIDQEIIQLKVFSQLTLEEIATATKLRSSNVATHYRRAMLKLENYLKNQEVEQKP